MRTRLGSSPEVFSSLAPDSYLACFNLAVASDEQKGNALKRVLADLETYFLITEVFNDPDVMAFKFSLQCGHSLTVYL